MRVANCCACPSSSCDVLLERLDDLLGAHAVRVDRVGDVVHHRLDLHPVGLLEQLDELLALGGLRVGQDAFRGTANGGHRVPFSRSRCTVGLPRDARVTPGLALLRQGQADRMRIVVTGATGNAGTSVLAALAADPRVDEIVGLARRRRRGGAAEDAVGGRRRRDGRRWRRTSAAPTPSMHLAWLIQPSRDERDARGRQRPRLAPRVRGRGGAPAPARSCTRRPSAPTRPGPTTARSTSPGRRTARRRSFYARHKAAAERALDEVEAAHPRAARRPPAPGPDLQARGRVGDPAAVRRPAAALAARATRSSLPGAARCRAACGCRPCTATTWGRPTGSRRPTSARRGAYNVAAEPVLDEGDARPAARRARRRGPGRAGARGGRA